MLNMLNTLNILEVRYSRYSRYSRYWVPKFEYLDEYLRKYLRKLAYGLLLCAYPILATVPNYKVLSGIEGNNRAGWTGFEVINGD